MIRRNILPALFAVMLYGSVRGQDNNILGEQTFGKGATVFFLGSGAGSKVLDPARFDRSNQKYYRSPFFLFGIDHCVFPKASNAYWGFGLMISSSFTERSYLHGNVSRRDFSTNTLVALKASHHHAMFVTRHLDMCSGIVIGSRVLNEHLQETEKNSGDSQRTIKIFPAFGISATVRYYFRNNLGVYFEACLGYKTDLAHVGLVYKIRKAED